MLLEVSFCVKKAVVFSFPRTLPKSTKPGKDLGKKPLFFLILFPNRRKQEKVLTKS